MTTAELLMKKTEEALARKILEIIRESKDKDEVEKKVEALIEK